MGSAIAKCSSASFLTSVLRIPRFSMTSASHLVTAGITLSSQKRFELVKKVCILVAKSAASSPVNTWFRATSLKYVENLKSGAGIFAYKFCKTLVGFTMQIFSSWKKLVMEAIHLSKSDRLILLLCSTGGCRSEDITECQRERESRERQPQ